jgi:DNA-binding transcriptional MerR regulator
VPQLTISEVARRVGLQPSAIRYYERIGILLPAHRIGGQRRYDPLPQRRYAIRIHLEENYGPVYELGRGDQQ